MTNQYGYVYEARFKNKNYEYITGNTDFYAFRGDNLYTTFDKMMAEGSREVLEKAIEEKAYNRPFVLAVYSGDEKPCSMVCVITEESNSEHTVLRMIEVDRMYERYSEYFEREQENTAILAQLDGVYYSYDAEKNFITVYVYEEEKRVVGSYGLREWTDKAAESLPDKAKGELMKFVSNLKNGTRNFSGVINLDGDKGVRFSGTAIYHSDVHVKTVGSIRGSAANQIKNHARHDQLTGLYMKEDITNYAKSVVEDLKQKSAMAIIDIDNFKNVNDHWGHSTGDAVLRKCAAIIAEQVGKSGKVGRIGGDEFYMIVKDFEDEDSVRNILRGIKNNISQAYSEETDGFQVTTSIGVSCYPEHATDFNTLYNLADHMLYLAKNKGKNRYIIYRQDKHGSVEDILKTNVDKVGIVSRRGLSKSEAVCQIADLMIRGKTFSAEDILQSIVKYFGVERIILYNVTDGEIAAQCGEIPLRGEDAGYLCDEGLNRYFEGSVMIVNNIRHFRTFNPQVYDKFLKQGIMSVMQHRIKGGDQKDYVISYESITNYDTWNAEDLYLYRIIDTILPKCI
ncbi:MAG: GGDEF domain-containing protein [Lachnospiraceae bacterium]|nr:GGDEF domain-containing protein [Ruminococcus sp.]MCM1274069.1 GGDEF domain-containing protein [Lachnospiraceae bacterium]